MTQTFQPSASQSGFTLIELLVVLAIISLMAIVIVPRLDRKPRHILAASDLARLTAAFALSRQSAREKGVSQIVDLSRLGKPVRWHALESATMPRVENPVFYPDGSAAPGVVDVDGTPALEVTWFGEVRSRDAQR